MRPRHRVIVGAFVLLGTGVGGATLWQGPEIARRWKHRNDIRAVRTLEELEEQREVLVGNVPVKFGVDTVTPDAGAPVLLYATSRSAPAQVLIHVGGEYVGTLFSQGPYDIPGRGLFLATVPVGKGEQAIELTSPGGAHLGRCTVCPTEKRFHAFMPLGGVNALALPVVPEFAGGVGLLDAETEDWPHVRGLPKMYPDDPPTMRLERHGDAFTLTAPSQVFPNLGLSVLLRLWVNGEPFVAPLPKGRITLGGYAGNGALFRRTTLDFGLHFSDEQVRVRPGDRIGVQCFWAPQGWHVTGYSGIGERGAPFGTGAALSNRIDFTVP